MKRIPERRKIPNNELGEQGLKREGTKEPVLGGYLNFFLITFTTGSLKILVYGN